MSKLIAGWVVLGAVALALSRQGEDKAAQVKPEGEPPVVRSAECRWAEGPVKLDGIFNETAWDKADAIEHFPVYWQKRKAKTATQARFLWDRKYIYFLAEMEDADLYADIEEQNGMLWHNDVFELFFKPSKDKLGYYEFQVNALNTRLELFLPSRGAGGYQRFKGAGSLGMESAVKLAGTLNKWEDRDKGWLAEGRIPWTAFKAITGGRQPEEGDVWRFALCRYDYSAGLEQPELSSSAPLTQPDFHRYEEYGELKFTLPK